jgi:hypothetical protein
MKMFEKNKDNLFICKECNKLFKSKTGLCSHIKQIHKDIKKYFDTWLNEKDNECIICKSETKFISIGYGYNKCCSTKCSNNYRNVNKRKSTLKKYGVESIFLDKKMKDKIKKTFNKKYNVDNAFQSSFFLKKRKETFLKKYGVENPAQDINIYNKGLKTRFAIHKYKDTNLTYQGSYELDFLEKYSNKFKIENGPSIKYEKDNKNKVYHSDFYIPSKNLIVEIKSSWTLSKDGEIEEKKKATIANGFNYLMILDKNYKI